MGVPVICLDEPGWLGDALDVDALGRRHYRQVGGVRREARLRLILGTNRELLDYVALLPRLRYLSGSVYLALLHRAACIDPATNEEWPTIELAQASRTIETNPIAQGNLPLWERITTADTVPCPDVVRRITLRWMSDPDVHEPI